jgi:hypothetical protein
MARIERASPNSSTLLKMEPLARCKASLVMTNVIGPEDKVYLAGVPVDQMMFWVPHPGNELRLR